MTLGFVGLDSVALIVAVAFAVLAGLVKGTTGFAMPMVMISGLGSFLSPELALAGLILPTLLSNVWQALRNGVLAAIGSARAHKKYILIALICIAVSSQFVTRIPAGLLFTILGVTITTFTVLQLAGWKPVIQPESRGRAELGIGVIAGTLGGFTGTWGPPTVMYLTALNTPKIEHVRVQGIVYGTGAIMLTLAHLKPGVLSGDGLRLSFFLLIPAMAGMLSRILRTSS